MDETKISVKEEVINLREDMKLFAKDVSGETQGFTDHLGKIGNQKYFQNAIISCLLIIISF